MKYKKSISKDTIIFLICVVALFIIVAYAATYYMPDYFHIEGWFSMLTNIAISYVAAVFFYLFQVYLPEKRKAKLAIEANRSLLYDMQKKLIITGLVMEKYFSIENNHLTISWNGRNEDVLYFGYSVNGNDGKKNATPCSYSKNDFQNLKRSFTDKINQIKQSVYAPYFDDDLLKLLSDLEMTGLFDSIQTYIRFYNSDIGINGIKKDINDMRNFADRIGVYTGNKCDLLLTEADATSRIIAKAMRNPQMLRSLDSLNIEISKEVVRDEVDKKVKEGIITENDGKTMIEAVEKTIRG